MDYKAAFFESSQNVTVSHSNFVLETGRSDTVKQEKLDTYFKAASLNAILNRGGRADPVRCYPGTREEVIGKAERWMDGEGDPAHRMLWLRGHAGAGKSAIAQTLAENGAKRKIHSANFFFFRGDKTRNHARPLVATLVYQLLNFYPSLHDHLASALISQPLAHEGSVEEQFAQLLAAPIKKMRHSLSIDPKIILIIDGLDECEGDESADERGDGQANAWADNGANEQANEQAQAQILSALHVLTTMDNSPFRVFISSRAEPHLVRFFNGIDESANIIFLNDEFGAEDDIWTFVNAKFKDIKRTHHLARTLGEHWPAQADISQIVAKSSGQFIFAATVLRFIELSRDSPSLSLRIVLQMRPPTSHSPFAQLDALYSHVLSKARDIYVIKWVIWANSDKVAHSISLRSLPAMEYEPAELQSLCSDVSSIAQISIDDDGCLHSLSFYHASFTDFLMDKARAGIYHVDSYDTALELTIHSLQKFQKPISLHHIAQFMYFVDQPTTELSKALLDASERHMDLPGSPDRVDLRLFISVISRLYFPTNKAMFKRIVSAWIRFAYAHKINPVVENVYFRSVFSYIYYEYLRITAKAKFEF